MKPTKTTTITARIWMLTALLLMATTGYAQLKVSLEDHTYSSRLLKSENSFTGSNITEEKNSYSNGVSSRHYVASIVPGQTITADCEGSYTVAEKESEYKISITISYYKEVDGKTVSLREDKKQSTSKPLSLSSQVPEDATRATMEISCYNGDTFNPEGTLCFVRYTVQNKNTETAGPITGTMERLGMKRAASSDISTRRASRRAKSCGHSTATATTSAWCRR